MLSSGRSLHYRFETVGDSGIDLLVYSDNSGWVFCPISWVRTCDLTDTYYKEHRTSYIVKALSALRLIVRDARKVRYLR